jgi:hypothetical protein
MQCVSFLKHGMADVEVSMNQVVVTLHDKYFKFLLLFRDGHLSRTFIVEPECFYVYGQYYVKAYGGMVE